jgi:hypothetical protein
MLRSANGVNDVDAVRKRVVMRKAQLRVRRAWKVRECDKLGCGTQGWQEGLNVQRCDRNECCKSRCGCLCELRG